MHPFYVVIATANNLLKLKDTLRSIERCDKPDSFSCIVVVENGPKLGVEDFTAEVCSLDLRVQYLYSAQANKSLALNTALSWLPQGSAIFFTDDDVELDPAVLVEYSRAVNHYGKGHYFGGPVGRAAGSAEPLPWLVSLIPRSVTGWSPDPRAENRLFLGCNWAAFTSDLLFFGGFDPSVGPGSKYGAVGQESNMQARLLLAGCRPVFVETALVSHYVSGDSVMLTWLLRRRYREGIYKGISQKNLVVKQPATCFYRPDINVISPYFISRGVDGFLFRVAKRVLQLAEVAGILKGWYMRRFGCNPIR